ncbi:hypothetical protein RND71_015785 [Anisodus tanguticus]|uniref:Uncharacterized protein n=1 Tax=Anisodus tanguticus TaxID=243964 RepID=A0AAE1S7R2_9SOLA|nr:hypothetical protein RND71_015785 [Anisodus tanguticus]
MKKVTYIEDIPYVKWTLTEVPKKVQVDLLSDLQKIVMMEIEDEVLKETREVKVKIQYDFMPKYYTECMLQGHSNVECQVLHSELNKASISIDQANEEHGVEDKSRRPNRSMHRSMKDKGDIRVDETNKLVEDKVNEKDSSKEQLKDHQSELETSNGPSPVKVINYDNQVIKEQMNDIQNVSTSENHSIGEVLVTIEWVKNTFVMDKVEIFVEENDEE